MAQFQKRFMMIPVLLAMLLVGSQARLPNLFGAIFNPVVREPLQAINLVTKGMTRSNVGAVDVLGNVAKTGTFGLVDVSSDAKQEDMGVVGQAANRVVGQVATGVKKEVGGVFQPVESILLTTATSQCAAVKKILGVDAYSINSLNDQDLNRLTLNFYTPQMQVVFNISDAARQLSQSQYYNPRLPLIIFAHGFLSNPSFESFTSILNALQRNGQYNVLAIDSSAYIGWFYLRASTYVQFIGEKMGGVLAAMYQRGLRPESVHLIGYSLGAHISGFAGKAFYRLTGQKVGRISGLDAAGPCFYNVGSELKLQAFDANFVDVIHTTHGSLGITEPIGHVDFYPNGGTQQPDCFLQVCSHERVWALYAESIYNEEAFPSVKCEGWDQFRRSQCEENTAFMGFGCPSDTRGLYFLQTRGASPFGLGDVGVRYMNNEGILKSLQPLGPSARLG